MSVTDDQAARAAPVAKPDKRWQKTHARLLNVGLDVISELGAEGASVDLIVKRANITKQTFFHHFQSIESLIDELWRETIAMVEAEIRQTNHGIDDPAFRLARGVAVYARLCIVHRARTRFMSRYWYRTIAISEGNPGLESDLSAGMISGRFRINDVESAMLMLLGGAGALIRRLLEAETENEAKRLTQDVLFLMMNTLGMERREAQGISARVTEDIFAQATGFGAGFTGFSGTGHSIDEQNPETGGRRFQNVSDGLPQA